MSESQLIIEHALSPFCLKGQHDKCKGEMHYMPDDGNARTLRCPCRCHSRRPAAEGEPQFLYHLVYEYAMEAPNVETEGKEPLKAWVKREIFTTEAGIVRDWMDELIRMLTDKPEAARVLKFEKAPIREWVTESKT